MTFRRICILLAVEIGILAYVYLHLCPNTGGYGFPLDDSWIHAHFARNIAQGKGIVYNPGQHVTSTALLYSLLLAGMYAVAVKPILNAIVLGLVLHFGASMLMYATARRLSLSPLMSAFAAVVFAALPRLMWGALSGMEVPLYVFLVCLGIYWHVRYLWRDGARAYLASFAFALAALARPECAAFVVCSLATRFVEAARSDEKKSLVRFCKTLPVHAGVFAITVAPVLAYDMASYGLPLPPAYYAKTRVIGAPPASGIIANNLGNMAIYLGEAVTICRRDNVILCWLLAPGMIACLWASRKREASASAILPMAIVIIPAVTGLAAPMGPHRSLAQLMAQHGRYSSYLCPLLVLIGVLGIVRIGRAINFVARTRRWFGRTAMCMVGAAIAVVLVTGNIRTSRVYPREVQNINQMQVALGRWAAGLPKGTVLAVNDAGAIAYFSNHRILDTVGVVNPEVVPYLKKYSNRQPGLLEYLRERKPRYVIIFPTWYPRIADRSDILHPIKSIKLEHNIVCGGREMVVYRATWK